MHGLREGFRYAFGFPPVRSLLLLVALIGLVGMPYVVLMPIFAGDILHGDERTYGFLLGSSGVGALAGSLYLASRRTVLGLGRWIAAMSGLFGIGLFVFSFSRSVPLSMALLVVMGFAVIVQLASCNTILQTVVEERAAGSCDEPLYDGVPGHVSLGKPRRRQPGIKNWRSKHAANWGRLLRSGGNRLRPAAADFKAVYPADLHSDGNPAERGHRPATGDGAISSAGRELTVPLQPRPPTAMYGFGRHPI